MHLQDPKQKSWRQNEAGEWLFCVNNNFQLKKHLDSPDDKDAEKPRTEEQVFFLPTQDIYHKGAIFYTSKGYGTITEILPGGQYSVKLGEGSAVMRKNDL